VSADLVNLRRVRKAAQRKKAEAIAAENRAAFGLSAAERERVKTETDRGARHLDQHRLTSPPKS
jgi:hypothetical protein